MEYLRISFEAIMPVFFPMLLGYVYQRIKPIPEDARNSMNQLVFKVFLPLLLFCNTYGSIVDFQSSSRLIVFLLVFITLVFLLLSLLVPKFVKEPSRRGTLVQGIMRSNSALYGIPVASALMGESVLPLISVVIATIVIPFNLYSILALELNRAERPGFKSILREISTNMLLISILTALLFNALHINLPPLLYTGMHQMGAVATPLSFFVLGASFTFRAAAKNKKTLAIATILRLIAVPIFFLVPAYLLGFRGAQLVCVLVVSAPPTAVSSFPMACAMGGDGGLASELVVFTSAFSVITMFLWILLLNALGLM